MNSSVGEAFQKLLELCDRLLGPDGCPWDREQTHQSLSRYLIEEAYEVVDEIDKLDNDPEAYELLCEELGDLLYQVVFHAALAQRDDRFEMSDVISSIHDKLVHRHPHVFGDSEARTSEDVMQNWEQLKGKKSQQEVPSSMPALLAAQRVARKVAADGTMDSAILSKHADAVVADPNQENLAALLGTIVQFAHANKLDAEAAMRAWIRQKNS